MREESPVRIEADTHMNEHTKTESPSSVLAQRIVSRLVDEGLLGKESASSLEIKITQGKMQASDWKLVFEKALNMHKKR
jgi:hypothetical protein